MEGPLETKVSAPNPVLVQMARESNSQKRGDFHFSKHSLRCGREPCPWVLEDPGRVDQVRLPAALWTLLVPSVGIKGALWEEGLGPAFQL